MKVLILLSILHVSYCAENCNFPTELIGTWTSTNLSTVTISKTTPSFTVAQKYATQTVTNNSFVCYNISGTQYILKSTGTVLHNNVSYTIWICLDLRRSSAYSYNYYLNSIVEPGLGRVRMAVFPIANTTVKVSDVCTATLDIAEFQTMYKAANYTQAVAEVGCPNPLRVSYWYNCSGTTNCTSENVTTVIGEQNYTQIRVNNTGCSKKLFYSSANKLGCLTSMYDSVNETYYTVLIDMNTTSLTCVVLTKDADGVVYISHTPTVCEYGQRPMVKSKNGSLFQLNPFDKCLPVNPDYTLSVNPDYSLNRYSSIPVTVAVTTKTENSIWLVILLVCIGAVIIIIIIIVCVYVNCKKAEKAKARRKSILVKDDHPLVEMSMPLDIPGSMERDAPYVDIKSELTYSTPRSLKTQRKKQKEMLNPFGETSMYLDFNGPTWAPIVDGGLLPTEPVDPFTEMDNGFVSSISPEGSKAETSVKHKPVVSDFQRQNTSISKKRLQEQSFIYGAPISVKTVVNGDVRRAISVIDTRSLHPVQGSINNMEQKTVKSEKSFVSKPAQNLQAPIKEQPLQIHVLSAKTVKSSRSRNAQTPHKFARSRTRTKIGSITNKLAPNKKKLARSKSMVIPTAQPEYYATDGAMNEFLNAELATRNLAKVSVKSNKTSKPRSLPRPKKSILKRDSTYMSSHEYNTDKEQLVVSIPPLATSAISSNASVSRSLHGEFLAMLQRQIPDDHVQKVGATKKAWH